MEILMDSPLARLTMEKTTDYDIYRLTVTNIDIESHTRNIISIESSIGLPTSNSNVSEVYKLLLSRICELVVNGQLSSIKKVDGCKIVVYIYDEDFRVEQEKIDTTFNFDVSMNTPIVNKNIEVIDNRSLIDVMFEFIDKLVEQMNHCLKTDFIIKNMIGGQLRLGHTEE